MYLSFKFKGIIFQFKYFKFVNLRILINLQYCYLKIRLSDDGDISNNIFRAIF